MGKKGKQKLKQDTIPEEPEEEDQAGFGGLGLLGDSAIDSERDKTQQDKKTDASPWGGQTNDAWGAQPGVQPGGWGTGAWGAPTNPLPEKHGAWGAANPQPAKAGAWGPTNPQPAKAGAWGPTNPQPMKSHANPHPPKAGAWGPATTDDSWGDALEYEDYEEGSEEEDGQVWGTGSLPNAASAWGHPPPSSDWGSIGNASKNPKPSAPKSGWRNWAAEANHSSKNAYLSQQPASQTKSKVKKDAKKSKSTGHANDPWAAWGSAAPAVDPNAWNTQANDWEDDDDWGTGNTGGGGWGADGGGWGEASWGVPAGTPSNKDSLDSHGKRSKVWGKTDKSNSFSMPSKTLSHAVKGDIKALENVTGFASTKMDDYTNVHFVQSKGEALAPVVDALFGTHLRLAKDRFHWLFSPNKDPRVSSLLDWIQTMAYGLGSYGLEQFLRTRERGALFTNADFHMKEHPKMPVFDWLTFDDVQKTKDRILQESVAFYDPAVQVIVFVFLPSKTGNSIAIWRRKIAVPNNTRLIYQREIAIAKSGLRRDLEYVVHVDEIPTSSTTGRRSLDQKQRPKKQQEWSSTSSSLDILYHKKKKKKKPKWWQFWRVDWD
ncbi:hypothetical protein DL96DRAFT_1593939 [Flagelloscypha sp. PMI_526]|nr:hypothetical protein DL96DRAFT_1593939 [Flagelloscypha sp. PMI_526]